MNKSFTFMAFAAGKESTEGAEIKRYIGIAPVFILGVNPNKAELEKLYNTTIENEPQYVGETEINGKKVRNARIDFIIKTDPSKCNGIELITKNTFFIANAPKYNRDNTKIQVIDKYGRTAWAKVEEVKNHEIPVYSNGSPANIDKDYRPCYNGEEYLINFMKNYLGISNVMKYINGTWVMTDHPEDCEAGLEKIDKYFTGDFSEIKDIINIRPSNKVKLIFGVKTTDDNKMYQTVCSQISIKNNVTDYSKVDKELKEKQANGAYPNVVFSTDELKEYVVESTNFNSNSNVGEMPFDTEAPESPWFNN